MPNTLSNGTRRVGDLIDTQHESPEVKVTLEHSHEGISATIAWSHPDVPYADWFLRQGGYISGMEPQESAPLPSRVIFRDSHGSVLLVRCFASGFHANFRGPGSGTLWARAAVLGVEQDLEYERPHGLVSEISELRRWLKVTSWKTDLSHQRPTEMTIRSATAEPISIGTFNGLDLKLQPTWRWVPEDGRDRQILLDLVECTTEGPEPNDWDAHMSAHRAIRDLLVISRWRSESCVPTHVMRQDDLLITLDGKSHGAQWRETIVPDNGRVDSPSSWQTHLIEYADIKVDGIARWIALRDDFSRALDPVISSIDLQDTNSHTLLAHTGPGLEALGYLLLLRDGATERTASSAPLRQRLERILLDVSELLPFDGDEWATLMSRTYNGLKHANRARPETIEVLRVWAESVMVTRAWVAVELGVPKEVVKSRLESDRQPRAFQSVD